MLNRMGPKPLYLQLEEILRRQIKEGQLKPQEAIPSENELCKLYDLSRMTVRGVITRLVSDRLLYRVPGKGTFVAEPKITTGPLSQKGIREQLEAMGYETGTTVLEKEIGKANSLVAGELGLAEEASVYRLKRLRCANGGSLSLDLSYIPQSLCEGLFEKDLEREALCNILSKHYGIVAAFGTETLESCQASAQEAKLLGVPKGSPLLILCYTLYSGEGRPFEYSKVVFRGDRIKLKFSFSR